MEVIGLSVVILLIVRAWKFIVLPIYYHFYPPTEEQWIRGGAQEPYPEQYRQHYRRKNNT